MLGYTHVSQDHLNVKNFHLPRGSEFLAHLKYLRQLSVPIHVPEAFSLQEAACETKQHCTSVANISNTVTLLHILAKTW